MPNPHAAVLARRRNIRRFIREDPVELQLVRSALVSTAAAGTIPSEPEELQPQTFRLILNESSPLRQTLARLEQGLSMPHEPWLLIGDHEVDIQKGDTFEHESAEFEVTNVTSRTAIKTVAGCKMLSRVNG